MPTGGFRSSDDSISSSSILAYPDELRNSGHTMTIEEAVEEGYDITQEKSAGHEMV